MGALNILWRSAMAVTMLPIWNRTLRGKMLRGLGLKVHPTAGVNSLCWFANANVAIGAWSKVNVGCMFDGDGGTVIGDNVMVGPRCSFFTTTHPIGGHDRRRAEGNISRAVVIGDGSWVHGCVVFQPGATVGEGSIVHSGSVVHGDMPSNAWIGGAPATVRRLIEPVAGRICAASQD